MLQDDWTSHRWKQKNEGLVRWGTFAAVLALNALPGVSQAYFTFTLASTFVVKQAFRALQQQFRSCRLISSS